MTELIVFMSIIAFVFVIAVVTIKYVGGHYTYRDTIIEKNKYTRTATNSFVSGGTSEQVYRILIERRYESGRIKFFIQEIPV